MVVRGAVEGERELLFDRDESLLGRDLARERSEHRGLPCPGCPCDDHLLASPDGRSEELTQATVDGSQPLKTVQVDLHEPAEAKCDARPVADPRHRDEPSDLQPQQVQRRSTGIGLTTQTTVATADLPEHSD